MEFTVKQIAEILGGVIEGNAEEKVNRLDKIQEGSKGGISFLSNPKYEPYIYETESSAVIVANDFKPTKKIQTTLIKVADPYTSFSKLLEAYAAMNASSKVGVEEPAYMAIGSKIGDKHYRGAFSYIGENCEIGENVKIYPHVYIGDNVKIGNNTTLFAGAKIYADTVIGSNCVIHSGAVIGSDGFGFAPQADGSYKAIPQLGNVILEDDVVIGANTVIDCATLNATIIRKGVKMDNLIQIGHNVEVGENTVIAAQAGISGSTKVGKNVIIGGQVGAAGHIEIPNKTIIAAKAGVSRSHKKEGLTLMGTLGFEIKDYMKSYVLFKKLPDLEQRLKELEKKS